MPTSPPNSGPSGKGMVGDIAMQMAQGTPLVTAMKNAAKDTAIVSLLGPSAMFAGILLGALKTMKAIVDQSGILERGLKRLATLQQIQGRFETLLKSAEAAKDRIKDLYAFAANTPFDFKDIAEGNRSLQALTKGALAGAEGMKMIGDAAAATGRSFSDVADDVGKLYAAMKSGRGLERVLFLLQREGIVTEELARKLELAEASGHSFAEMWSLVTANLARTEGGMQNEMRTVEGLNKRLANASALMEQAFAAPYLAAHTKALENTLRATQNLTPVLSRIAVETQPILQFFTNVKNSVVDTTLATKGFASSLGVAWDVLKIFAGGALATVLGGAAGGLSKAARGLAGLKSGYAAGKEGPRYTGAMEKASAASTGASAAMAEGAVGTALALKMQAMWATLSAKALNLNSAALATMAEKGAKYNIITHTAYLITGALTMGLGALLVMAKRVGLALVAGMLTPIGMLAAAAGAAAIVIQTWTDHLAAADQKMIDLIQSTAKETRNLREMIKAIKDVSELDPMQAQLEASEKAQRKAIADMGERPKGVLLPTSGRFVDEEGKKWDEEMNIRRGALARTLALQKTLPSRETLTDDKTDVQNALALRRIALNYEMRIAAVRQRGGETAVLEGEKEKALAGAKLNFALARQKAYPGTGEADTAEAAKDIADFASRQAEVRKKTGLERAANDLRIAGAPNKALALQDAAELARKREEYRAAGMPEGYAETDWAAGIMAQAKTRMPRIIADSLQAIGGGGGSAGTDPMLAATERIQTATRENTNYLRRIAEALEGGRSGGTIKP